jgi:hypothetical protein
LDEQPIPESLMTFSGGIASSKKAWTMAAVIESWPQPAHSVLSPPS